MKVLSTKYIYFISLFLFGASVLLSFSASAIFTKNEKINNPLSGIKPEINPIPSPTPTPINIPSVHIIPLKKHVFQTFNNCGPATLSMALSYVGMDKSQEELGQILRPYQVPGGDNDDKSVTLQEVADQAEKYGLYSYLRPNGTIEKLKKLIANDVVVVTRTWLKDDEDIGHYRVVRGYDDTTSEIIQDDTLQNKNLRYSFDEFLSLWQPFNYEYLVIVEESKKDIVEHILGEEFNEIHAWENAKKRIEHEIDKNPDNWHLAFALSRTYFYLKDYDKSVEIFNSVENKLSFRILWYQIEPIKALYETKDYDRLFALTEKVLKNENRAFTELYMLRGKAYQKLGENDFARSEFEKAVLYNQNNTEAQSLLNSI